MWPSKINKQIGLNYRLQLKEVKNKIVENKLSECIKQKIRHEYILKKRIGR